LPLQPGTGQPGIQFASNPFTDQKSRSNEFRFDGKFKTATWRLGYYNSHVEDVGAAGLIQYRLPLRVDPTGDVQYLTNPFSATLSKFIDKNHAYFGSIAVPFLEKWTVEAEARQATEDRSQQPLNRSRSFTEFTPRVNLKWQPQPGWMFYASAAKGTKSGGFNGVTADVATYEPEKNITYELGGKQALADNTLQLNYAVFFIDWSDLQLSVPDTVPTPPSQQDPNYIGNVKGATSKGVEFEAVWIPSTQWRVNLAASYVQSQFKDGTVDTTFGRLCESSAPVCVFLPRSPQYPLGGSPIGGNDLPRTPKSKASLGAEYRLPVFGAWELSLRGDLNYQSKYYAENLNLAYLPSRMLLNANISMTDVDGKWYASLWAKNLTDELYASSAFAVSVINQYGPALGDGRTAGLTVRYNFK
jgi:iron complex outermembrane receptor protein